MTYQTQPAQFDFFRFFLILGVIFFVILAAGAIVVICAAIWFICTAPLMALVNIALRSVLLFGVGVVVWRSFRAVRPFLPFRWR